MNQVSTNVKAGKDIVIFDGECNLCNGVVGWIIKQAPNHEFQFVAFQSILGQHLLQAYGFPTLQLDTVILIDHDGIHTHSDGFIKIVSKIPKWSSIANLLSLVPQVFRDDIYNSASKNRVKWFGKSKSCAVDLKIH